MSHTHDSKSHRRSNRWSSGEAFIKGPQCNLSGRKTAWWLIANLSLSYNIWPVERISIQSLSDVRAHPQHSRELWKATGDKSANALWPRFSKVFFFFVAGPYSSHELSFYLTLGPDWDVWTDTGQGTMKFGIESNGSNRMTMTMIILVIPWPLEEQNCWVLSSMSISCGWILWSNKSKSMVFKKYRQCLLLLFLVKKEMRSVVSRPSNKCSTIANHSSDVILFSSLSLTMLQPLSAFYHWIHRAGNMSWR